MTKRRITIVITIEDDKDFKLHMSAAREQINAYLKTGNEDLREQEVEGTGSSHKYAVETKWD